MPERERYLTGTAKYEVVMTGLAVLKFGQQPNYCISLGFDDLLHCLRAHQVQINENGLLAPETVPGLELLFGEGVEILRVACLDGVFTNNDDLRQSVRIPAKGLLVVQIKRMVGRVVQIETQLCDQTKLLNLQQERFNHE